MKSFVDFWMDIRGVTIHIFEPKYFGTGLTVQCTFHFVHNFFLFFTIKFLLIITHSVVLMFCVEDHNGNKSWTSLCFYPQLYLMSFNRCKAFV